MVNKYIFIFGTVELYAAQTELGSMGKERYLIR